MNIDVSQKGSTRSSLSLRTSSFPAWGDRYGEMFDSNVNGIDVIKIVHNYEDTDT